LTIVKSVRHFQANIFMAYSLYCSAGGASETGGLPGLRLLLVISFLSASSLHLMHGCSLCDIPLTSPISWKI
jgi:hypothetical protein